MKKSLYVQLFRDYSLIKVIDFLVENGINYSKTQIAGLSGISFNTLDSIWKNLLKFKIIKKTRGDGKIGHVHYHFLMITQRASRS